MRHRRRGRGDRQPVVAWHDGERVTIVTRSPSSIVEREKMKKRFAAKTALAAAVVVGPVVGMSAGTADATPVWGGAYAVAYPWWGTNAHWSNLQIAQAFGPSNLVNNVYAQSSRVLLGL